MKLDLVTEEEAVAMSGYGAQPLRLLASRGKLTLTRTADGTARYRREEIAALAAAGGRGGVLHGRAQAVPRVRRGRLLH